MVKLGGDIALSIKFLKLLGNLLCLPFFDRTNDKSIKKGTNFPKKGTPTPQFLSQHHSQTVSPQPLTTEKSSLHDKTLEKSSNSIAQAGRFKAAGGIGGGGGLADRSQGEDRPGLSLPEVKGADSRSRGSYRPGRNLILKQ